MNCPTEMDPMYDNHSTTDTGYWTSDAESEIDSMEAIYGSDTE